MDVAKQVDGKYARQQRKRGWVVETLALHPEMHPQNKTWTGAEKILAVYSFSSTLVPESMRVSFFVASLHAQLAQSPFLSSAQIYVGGWCRGGGGG